jgi:hypothetical protein
MKVCSTHVSVKNNKRFCREIFQSTILYNHFNFIPPFPITFYYQYFMNPLYYLLYHQFKYHLIPSIIVHLYTSTSVSSSCSFFFKILKLPFQTPISIIILHHHVSIHPTCAHSVIMCTLSYQYL